MRFRIVGCAVALVACSNDVFAPDDGGDDAGDATALDVSPDVGKLEAAAADVSTPKKGIACGSNMCDPATSVCCGAGGWSSESCVPASGCTAIGDNALACDDESDCKNGDICCADFATITSTVTSSQCASSCVSGQIQLCRVSIECNSSGNCAALAGGKPDGLEKCQ